MITALLLATALSGGLPAPADERPINCGSCAGWNAPHAPFKLHGNSYYVGVQGLSAVLISTPDGHFLIDGGLPQSAAGIAANVHALGFDIRDVKWLLNSHAHFDHAGGLAALQRMSGAPVAASAETARALAAGRALPDDPQYAPDNLMPFPIVGDVRILADGEALALSGTVLTRHDTPGHAPGGNSWSWRSCADGDCLHIVFADSLTPVSEPDYRFSDHPAYVARFRASIARIRALDCDILISAHPEFSELFERQAAGSLVDADGCREYADKATARLDKRLAQEMAK